MKQQDMVDGWAKLPPDERRQSIMNHTTILLGTVDLLALMLVDHKQLEAAARGLAAVTCLECGMKPSVLNERVNIFLTDFKEKVQEDSRMSPDFREACIGALNIILQSRLTKMVQVEDDENKS